MTPLEAATILYDLGTNPVVVPFKSKNPNRTGWEDVIVTRETLAEHFDGERLNVGAMNGKNSHNQVDVDLDHPLTLKLAPTLLPATACVWGRPGKPRSHHRYRADPLPQTKRFKHRKCEVCGSIVELLSTGTHSLAPGSTHPEGEVVSFDRRGEPAPIDGAELLRRVAKLATVVLLANHWAGAGSRHDACNALAGALAHAGWPEDDVADFVGLVAVGSGDEEASARRKDALGTVRKHAAGGKVTGWPSLAHFVGAEVADRAADWLGVRRVDLGLEGAGGDRADYRLTDLGNAERLVAAHAERLRYVPTWGWMVYDGRRWARDAEGIRVARLAQRVIRGLYRAAADEEDTDKRVALARHAAGSERSGRIAAMLTMARSFPKIEAEPADFDADPWRLNVANGTLDLRTGELRPHDPADLITKLSPVAHDAGADCPRWDAFLEEIMDGNPRLIGFLDRAIGYSLTGSTRERAIFIPHGGGANGKSTFLDALAGVFGDYAQQTPARTLLGKRDSEVPNDIARLAGARLVTASESAEGRQLDEGLVKHLTGDRRVAARFMRAEWFEFEPEFKVWLATNHRPEIRGTDDAIWDRIRLIPFSVRFEMAQRDAELVAKLRAEAPGILARAVRGCRAWQREGLGVPPEVAEATAGYRADMDVLGAFLDECCVENLNAKVAVAALYAAYKTWAEAAGERVITQRKVGMRLQERGFRQFKGTAGVRMWRNLGLLAPGEAPTDPDPPAAPADGGAGEWRNGQWRNGNFPITPESTYGGDNPIFTPLTPLTPLPPKIRHEKSPEADDLPSGVSRPSGVSGNNATRITAPEDGDPNLCARCGEGYGTKFEREGWQGRYYHLRCLPEGAS